VRNPAYEDDDFPFFFVRENPADWPNWPALNDAEIVAIRAALHRVSIIRIINSNDAEDLVQDTLLTMIAKNPSSELEKGPLVWSMGILRKKVGNYYRRIRRYVPIEEPETPDFDGIRQSIRCDSPEAAFFHAELKQIVAESLENLPSDQRKAMELVISGLDSGEVAKELQPERYQSVITRIHRGRQKIAQDLARYGYAPGKPNKQNSYKRRSGRKRGTAA
jgi:RNA polymerase sigma factor (sigma-70 family)